MPLYEYECRKCRHRLEALQRFSDPPLTDCPECGGELRKLISSPAFQFKGSGWYVTDYARKKGGDEKSGEKAGGKKETKGDGGEGGGGSKGSTEGSGGKSSAGSDSGSSSGAAARD